MNVAFFDGFDPWESFVACVRYTSDKEYCTKAVELFAEVQAEREFQYGRKILLKAVLPAHVRRFAMAIDKGRRYVVIFIDAVASTAALFYERDSGGGFQLKFVDWITAELKALKNPHPLTFFKHL